MIPRAHITAWRAHAPWPDDAQVEQDLVLSRALIEIFKSPVVQDTFAFRGGTALHKLFYNLKGRYSEDIDLVQKQAGPIGPAMDAIRKALDPWLFEPKRKQGEGRVSMVYRFETTTLPVKSMRLKIEINTREHFSVLGFCAKTFTVDNPWFQGKVDLTVYPLEELLGTKLRALYQRKKGRDLYDLSLSLHQRQQVPIHIQEVVKCFKAYMEFGNTPVSRSAFEENLGRKLQDPAFLNDIVPLLRPGVSYDVEEAANAVLSEIVSQF